VRDDLRGYVVDELGDAEAVLVIDDTGDLKEGTCTAAQPALRPCCTISPQVSSLCPITKPHRDHFLFWRHDAGNWASHHSAR